MSKYYQFCLTLSTTVIVIINIYIILISRRNINTVAISMNFNLKREVNKTVLTCYVECKEMFQSLVQNA